MGSSRYPGGYWALPFRTPSQLVPLPGSPRLTSRVGSGTWQRVKYPLAAGSPRRIGLQTPRSQEKSALPLAVCIGSGWWRENRRPEFVPLPECPRRPFVIPGNPGNPTVPILVPLPEPVRIAAPLVSLPDLCAPPDDSEGAIRSGKPILISFQHPNRDLCRWAPCRGLSNAPSNAGHFGHSSRPPNSFQAQISFHYPSHDLWTSPETIPVVAVRALPAV